MADLSFIVASEVSTIQVALDPVRAMLNSAYMLNDVDDYPGMHSWMYETRAQLSPDLMRRNYLAFSFFIPSLAKFYGTAKFADLGEFIGYLDKQDPFALRDVVMADLCFLPDFKRERHPDLRVPTAQQFLDDAEVLVEYLCTLEEECKPEDIDMIRQAHALLTNPPELKELVISHAQFMWENALKAEWERARPLLEETVFTFRRIDFSDMDRFEAAQIITGRDLRNTSLAEMIRNSRHLIFTPTPHIGPYVSAFMQGDVSYIAFRPRLPEGFKAKSPAMGRSELLVRLNALADDTRLLILELFTRHEALYAQEVIELLDLSQSAASRHLRQLTATGYLSEGRGEGGKRYSLNRARVEDTLQAVRQFLLGR
jgi:DNA-binding transcriptional ArsR family regulator